MSEVLPFAVLAIALLALALFLLRRVQHERDVLKSDLEVVENHNRMLQDEREQLKGRVAELTAAEATLKERLLQTEAEKRAAEAERKALEARLATLLSEHQSLEQRVLGFQGEWSHQLSTLEEEIATLLRQLGEFRKGTQLPVAS
jgi:cell division septum initiation protein DivIVA